MSETPDYISAGDYCSEGWSYFVPGHDPAAIVAVDDADEFTWEPVFMYRQRTSSIDPFEREDDWPTVTRDKRGRYAPTYVWTVCDENDPGAEPWLALKYAEVSR